MHQDQLRRVLDTQRELICVWRPDGVIEFCNQAYRDYFGYGADVVGLNLNALIDWPEGDGPPFTVQWFLDGHRDFVRERVYPDQRAVEWTDTPDYDEQGVIRSVVSVGRDVTAKVAAERALLLTERRHRVMTSYILDSVVLLRADGSLIDTSARYREELGYDTADLDDIAPFSLVYEEDRERARTAFAALINRGASAEEFVEVRMVRADGTLSWLEITGINLLDDPEVGALVLTTRNIDRRKAVELELAERKDQAETALDQRIAFVEQVSHELRNPLHGMLGLSEVLTKANLPMEFADAAWGIFRQSSTMRRIVDDLLDVAQIEVGHLRVRPERVDLQFAFNDCAFIARKSTRPGVRLVVEDVPADLRELFADADRVRQSITNLLANACKYTAVGEVHLGVTRGAAPGTARIEVSDTGVGISVDDVHRLFLPYERGANERSPGVGLGLTIVKGTVEAMGGTVGAAPRRGGGSVFWFELPLAPVLVAQAKRAAGEGDDTGELSFSLKTLVVDDDPVNLMLAGMQLRQMGNEVVTAASGEEAMALLEHDQFDVALVDVQMPGMSGLDLVRLARQGIERLPLMAVMTASATAADRQAALEAGADMFVPKPASVADVREVLRRRLEHASN
jgi:hypothetical protein